MKDTIESTFGTKALEHALFYEHEGSLRFELSEGGSFVEMFIQAFNKATEVINSVFSETVDISVCLAFYGNKTLLGNLSVFKSLVDCQIEVPKEDCQIWQKQYPEGELRTFIAFSTTKKELSKFIWSALACDMGVKPRVNCNIYLYSNELGILVHPYDDRGMDILGPNKKLLEKLYSTFHHYLLEYDIEEMDKTYANK